MFSVIDATRRKSRLGTTRFRLRSVFLKIRCGSEQPISVCSAAGNLPRSLANKAESQKNSKSPMSTAYPVGRVLKMKEVVHECHNSILKSGLPVHLFLCFTPHWLGHRRKMGAISNRWIRVFQGDRRGPRPRRCNGRVGGHHRVQGCKALQKQGSGVAGIGTVLCQGGRDPSRPNPPCSRDPNGSSFKTSPNPHSPGVRFPYTPWIR